MNLTETAHRLRQTVRLLPLVCLLTPALPSALAVSTPCNEAAQVGQDHITFHGARFNYPQPGESTWYYEVLSGTRPSISHVVFALPCPDVLILDAGTWDGRNKDALTSGGGEPEPATWPGDPINNPPTGGTRGLKFDQGFQDGELRFYYFTVNDNYAIDAIEVVTKSGPGDASGLICGPSPDCITRTIRVDTHVYCENDAPWVAYTVSPVGFENPDQLLVTIEWLAPSGEVLKTIPNQPLKGTLLWLGARLNEDDHCIEWPGWRYDETLAQWVEVPSDVRDAATLRFSINPTVTLTVDYPPATEDCAPEPYVSIGNFVFSDANDDGRYDPAHGDVGLDGVLVELWRPGTAGKEDEFVASTLTRGGGYYLFQRVPSGDYYVVIPPGMFEAGYSIDLGDEGSSSPVLAGRRPSTRAGDDAVTDHDKDQNGRWASPSSGVGISNTTNPPGDRRVVSNIINVQATKAPPPPSVDPMINLFENRQHASSENLTLDFGFVINGPPPPTAVTLGEFRAFRGEGTAVVLVWRTLAELDSLGFHLERSFAGGPWQRVNRSLIPATGHGLQPQTYELVDANSPIGPVLVYRLIEIDLAGRSEVVATATAPVALTTRITASTSTSLSLQLNGVPAAMAVVEAAQAVAGPWHAVSTVTLDHTGTITLLIPVDPAVPMQFFRVRRD